MAILSRCDTIFSLPRYLHPGWKYLITPASVCLEDLVFWCWNWNILGKVDQHYGYWRPSSLHHHDIGSHGINYFGEKGPCSPWGRISTTCPVLVSRNCKYILVFLTKMYVGWYLDCCALSSWVRAWHERNKAAHFIFPGTSWFDCLGVAWKYFFWVLTHWGLVTPFGDIDLGQHWLR